MATQLIPRRFRLAIEEHYVETEPRYRFTLHIRLLDEPPLSSEEAEELEQYLHEATTRLPDVFVDASLDFNGLTESSFSLHSMEEPGDHTAIYQVFTDTLSDHGYGAELSA